MELLNDLYAWLAALPPAWIYAVLFVIAYGENVVPPIPGDIVVVIGGMLAATGVVSLPAVWALSTLAGALGFLSVYAAGWRMGRTALNPARYRWLPKGELARAERIALRYGVGVVLANRFLPGVRSVIGLVVGAGRMPAGRVALAATISAAAWSALTVGVGYALADNRAAIARLLGGFERVGTVLLAVLAIALAVWFVRRRKAPPSAGVS